MPTLESIQLTITQAHAGNRLDIALQQLLPAYSRSRLQAWVKAGHVKLNGAAANSKTKVWAGDEISLEVPTQAQDQAFLPENIPLSIVFEDDDLMVINKPAGLVVHPAAGNWSGTLLNALLHHTPALANIPRCGIVHRLDKDTTGLLVVAKTLAAQTSLVRQLQARTVKREYRAILWGQLWRNGTVKQPLGRSPHNRTKMAIIKNGKPAITHYEVLERFGTNTYVRCNLETGRTHQIRVHMQHLKAPLVGDKQYGIGNIIPHQHMNLTLKTAILGFERQALHAVKLGLIHPTTEQAMEWQIDLPDDMKALLEAMRYEDAPDDAESFDFGVDENGLYVGDDDEDWEEDDDFEDALDGDLEDD